LDERDDWPTAWTPDSKAVLFFSDRTGKYEIYKQPFDQDSAEPIATTGRVNAVPRLSADAFWILYDTFDKLEDIGSQVPDKLWRVPVSGGPSQLVLMTHGWGDHRCARAPATLCLVGEPSQDQKQLVLIAFDPLKGRGHEVTRISAAKSWDLSPDGTQIALMLQGGENHIRLLPVEGGEAHDVIVKGWYGLSKGPDFSADGKGIYGGTSSARGATLLYIDLKGHATPLWDQKGSLQTWGVPSPDGRHLAIMSYTVASDVWLVENF
jgi:Tol biopolymer transport system component